MLDRQTLASGDPRIGRPCAVCEDPFLEGDKIGRIPMGPGKDEKTREAARTGKTFTAACATAHRACVTGRDD